jgi:UDP-N-acetylmuramoylalanine--D-glutamate ligase
MTEGRLILIAGGDAKGADMQTLVPYLERHVAHVFAIGKDATRIAEIFERTTLHGSMQDAVQAAMTLAEKGDVVLLSPACASIDMFKNYMHRGEVFKEAVALVLANESGSQKVTP